jgi:hypothetical protein
MTLEITGSRRSLSDLPQKSPSSIIGRNGPLSNPTPTIKPQRREPLNLPNCVLRRRRTSISGGW